MIFWKCALRYFISKNYERKLKECNIDYWNSNCNFFDKKTHLPIFKSLHFEKKKIGQVTVTNQNIVLLIHINFAMDNAS